jgi:Domain of unknown function (DUF5668)/Cell wall-active antibiotics response 4TMS YvqF
MNATSTLPNQPTRHGGLAGPAILIALGVVFLLNNLGWDIWATLLRLWPLLLIAAGLDLLIGRRLARGAALVVVVLLAIVAAVWWSGAWWPRGVPVVGDTITQTLDGATRADVAISLSAGTLSLRASDDAAVLVNGTIKRAPRDQLERTFALSGDTAVFTLRDCGSSGWMLPFTGGRADQVIWDLRLTPEAPMHLKVDTGAGAATLDLARMRITDLDVNTGVGTTTVTVPGQGRMQAQINGGVGQTTVTIPAGVAVRIEAAAGLGQGRVLGDYQRQDKLYVSPGYDTAANRVDLHVNGGIGSITIEQAHGR